MTSVQVIGIVAAQRPFRTQCDCTVQLDTLSYFAGCPVKFEFQTIYTLSYEINNFINLNDLVKLLDVVLTDLAAMLCAQCPLFSPESVLALHENSCMVI